jgi:hypothetical protein
MQEEIIQMVDDDEIENVGIMSGFMDELEELISEIDAEDLEKNKGGDEADTAKLMGRTPNSPEILMNNLRGDMRSVDARREELADLVGMREAEETPEGVLTLLQSVLAQQEAVPPMPMAPPMPPQGMPPEMMGGMPPEMMGEMPPQGMPPQGMGIEAVMPDMPGMYRGGPVQNFNRGSGQMGVTPASDAFAAYPSDVVEEAKRRVRHMVDGGMVQKYNRGGVVQHFQDGSEEVVSSAGRFPAETVQGANAYIQQLLEQEPSAANIDLATAMNSEAELYKTLGLGTDPKDAQAQMLFDIGQAAFGYAGNVGADGRPMQGSAAARLSQSLGPLAGRVGARAGQMSKEGQALKMMALKGAQDKIATAQAADAALAARQGDLALDIAKQKPGSRMLTGEEVRSMGLDPEAGSWGIDGENKPFLAGGRTPAPLVNMGNAKLGQTLGNLAGAQLDTSYNSANGAMSTLNSIALIRPTLEEENGVFAGPLSGAKVYVNRLATSLGVEGATDQERLNNTVTAMRTLAQFELQAAEAMRGQGQITENERLLIRRTAAGDLTAMTQGEIVTLLGALEKTAQYKVSQHNARLDHFKTVYKDDPDTIKNLELFELGDVPIFNSSPPTGNRAAARAIIDGEG